MRLVILLSFVVVASAAALGVYWLTDLPLGVSDEWTWKRFSNSPDLAANLLLGGMTAVGYLALVAGGFVRLRRPECSRWEACAWLVGLGISGIMWIVMAEGTGTSGASIGRTPFVLYYPGSSGYFFKARYQAPDPQKFLRDYESLMRQGDVLHVGTHPPGLFLLFHGLGACVDHCPGLIPWITATQPDTVRQAFGILAENTRRQSAIVAPALSEADRAILWLAALIGLVLTGATVGPLYGFVRHYADRPTSWLCAATWPLIPAIAIFLPKSDVAYAFFAMLLGWLWLAAWRRKSLWLGGLAGGLWAVSLLCSLAFLPVALWLALLSLFESWPALRAGHSADERSRFMYTVGPAAVGGLLIFGAVCAWSEVALWKTFWLNYRNHAGFYAQFTRTYARWLAVNPLELAGAVGVPAIVWTGAGIWSALVPRRGEAASPFFAPCLATLIMWTWLWVSGKNSGEAARLWIFLMPYMLCCAGAYWSLLTGRLTERAMRWLIVAWFGCQLTVCLLTAQRVSGFDSFV